jgi:hypothetical protein
MKKTKTLYWIFTGLLAAGMLMSSIPDIMVTPEAVQVFKSLSLPKYLIPLLGVAKFLGVIAILVPGFPRLKEWAYAGFVYDLSGALYSGISSGFPLAQMLPVFLIGYLLIALSYIFYHKLQRAKLAAAIVTVK